MVTTTTGCRPIVPLETSRAMRKAIVRVEKRSSPFLSIAEAIYQQEVDDLIAPIGWRRAVCFAARQGNLSNTLRPR